MVGRMVRSAHPPHFRSSRWSLVASLHTDVSKYRLTSASTYVDQPSIHLQPKVRSSGSKSSWHWKGSRSCGFGYAGSGMSCPLPTKSPPKGRDLANALRALREAGKARRRGKPITADFSVCPLSVDNKM